MAAGRRIRILIVDDSAVMRSLLRSVVATDPGLEVAGTAADGESALSAIASLRPDVVLLDVIEGVPQGKGLDLAEAMPIAAKSIDSGEGANKLAALVEFTSSSR